jgi:transcriptional regulator with XRE-family HTH domain
MKCRFDKNVCATFRSLRAAILVKHRETRLTSASACGAAIPQGSGAASGEHAMSDAKVRNMEEFAALSGISRPTVSKYFNDPDSVRPTTRARIEEALARYDYRPNIFAMNQNRKLTKNVGIVVPYLADPFFAEMARRLEQRCIAAGYRPTLYSAHGQKDLEIDILDSLRSLKPAGVLLAPLGRASDRLEVEKFCRDVPTVLFDSNIEGMGRPLSDQTISASCRRRWSI